MPKNTLKEFVNLRQSLIAERAQLQNRLQEIEKALGGDMPVLQAAPAGRSAAPKAKAPARRTKNALSLKAAMQKVTSGSPKTKKEIFEAVQKIGYRFGGQDPMNAINVALYSKPKFRNDNGKFSPPK